MLYFKLCKDVSKYDKLLNDTPRVESDSGSGVFIKVFKTTGSMYGVQFRALVFNGAWYTFRTSGCGYNKLDAVFEAISHDFGIELEHVGGNYYRAVKVKA